MECIEVAERWNELWNEIMELWNYEDGVIADQLMVVE